MAYTAGFVTICRNLLPNNAVCAAPHALGREQPRLFGASPTRGRRAGFRSGRGRSPPARRGAGIPVPGAGARALLQPARVEQRCGQALGSLQAWAQSVQGRQGNKAACDVRVVGLAVPAQGDELHVVQAGTLDGATGHQTLAVGEQYDLGHHTRGIGTGADFAVAKARISYELYGE